MELQRAAVKAVHALCAGDRDEPADAEACAALLVHGAPCALLRLISAPNENVAAEASDAAEEEESCTAVAALKALAALTDVYEPARVSVVDANGVRSLAAALAPHVATVNAGSNSNQRTAAINAGIAAILHCIASRKLTAGSHSTIHEYVDSSNTACAVKLFHSNDSGSDVWKRELLLIEKSKAIKTLFVPYAMTEYNQAMVMTVGPRTLADLQGTVDDERTMIHIAYAYALLIALSGIRDQTGLCYTDVHPANILVWNSLEHGVSFWPADFGVLCSSEEEEVEDLARLFSVWMALSTTESTKPECCTLGCALL